MTVYRWTPDLTLHIIEIATFKLTYTHIYVCIHDRVEEFRLQFNDIIIYPVLGEQLTPIQPMWSAYPYALGFSYMVSICPYFLIWYPYAPTFLYGKSEGREVSGPGPAAADFPRDVCLTVSRNHAVFLLYCISTSHYVFFIKYIKICFGPFVEFDVHIHVRRQPISGRA